MNTTKAKYIGIIYTFLIALIQILAVSFFIAWILDLSWSSNHGTRQWMTFFDKGIPIILLFAYIFGRKIGGHLLYNLHGNQESYNVLHKTTTWALVVSLFVFYNIATFQEHGFEPEKIREGFIYTFGAGIALYLLNVVPSTLFSPVLDWLIKRHKK